ncbi:MAG TPA: STAS domain-containing protein [Acidobacteriaceae bacterium]|nr:STAS domain-containing protein [Acidobacteriaceae bacterium]
MSLETSTERLAGRAAAITLRGSLTARSPLRSLDTEVKNAMFEGVIHLVLDVTSVDYVDSAGLGLLMHIYNDLHQKGGSLRLCGVQPRLRKILETTHTDTLLAIDGSREQSIAAVRQLTPAIPGD